MNSRLAEIYRVHASAQYPRGREDLALVDSLAADSVHIWLTNDGALDDARRTSLAEQEQQLIHAIPQLTGPSRFYFQRLLDMVVLVLESTD
ncbi:hypothetical protein [Actinoplanes awajinensis]|uniref:Uncharacterized protein n=1 Tax=Actinoplanes awajinensis subsp. mycoplanecinus TaxID=135947 RepID=A0A0X3V8R5_9ACTN|nr:hypothetical protein [Actinoplanes awajinensis]KUL41098.1 hypothetical protein ADL15_05620 [Actinoplanes awajinensis subsp. mycoplanecinus]